MKNGIIFDHVSFGYSKNKLQIDAASFAIEKGSFVGVTGVNGSGKTTLALMLNGIIPHELHGQFSGTITVDGIDTKTKPVSYFAQKIGMVFQNPDFMLFNLSVTEEIAFGLKNIKLHNAEDKIKNALQMVGMEDFANRDPQTLSLGEKQKICLAAVLALDTEYIVLDEPVAMLDYQGAVNLYRILDELNKKHGKTIIVIEHDTDFLSAHAKHTIIINRGKILFNDTTKKVFAHKTELRKIGIKIPQPIR
ncbi:MAG TPA: ABC transporter ATP-binding protein [Patescibacteria group bacterium]